ncbi:MAG: flagellin, partial [Lachnospiraceae bacterium]|nr:flagellin [Lachnospiraceae bacterium]
RDTDMAKESVAFAKHNILEQVGQSVLTQANQSTQGVLQILR